MTAALGSQGANPSPHFRAVMLCPSEDVTKFEAADEARFRTQLWALVAETHERWPTERFWLSPQGRICRDFDGHPILGKYLRSVNFDPTSEGRRVRELTRVSSYDPARGSYVLEPVEPVPMEVEHA
jgi:hypothetical protein